MSTNNGLRYPDTTPGMSIGDFKKWTVSQLKEFLGDRGINRDGLRNLSSTLIAHIRWICRRRM